MGERVEDEEKGGSDSQRRGLHITVPSPNTSPHQAQHWTRMVTLLRAAMTSPPFGAEFPHNSARDLFGPRKSSCQMIWEFVHGCSAKIQATEQRKHFSAGPFQARMTFYWLQAVSSLSLKIRELINTKCRVNKL